jgi:uncharacterized protein YpmB
MYWIIGIIILIIVAIIAVLAYRNNQAKVEDALKTAGEDVGKIKADVQAVKDKAANMASALKK